MPVREPNAPDARSDAAGFSVRARLTIVITLVAALGMLAVGLAVYAVERHRITESVQDQLRADLESVRLIVGTPPDGGWADATEALTSVMRVIVPGVTGGTMGVIDGEVALVPGIGRSVDPSADEDFVALVVDETAGGEVVAGTYRENGRNWAYLAAPIEVSSDQDTAAVFVTVYDLDLEYGGLELSARAYLIAAAVAVALIAAVSWFVSTRLLRPLRDMREMAERVSAQSLDERLPQLGRDDVSSLARTMNGMLDRLDEAMAAQRRLLGDVGHELKTPLTIVHGYLDVMDAKDPIDVEHTRRLAVDEIERMGRLVGDLVDVAVLLDDEGLRRAHVPAGTLLRTIAQKATMIADSEVVLGEIAEADAEIDAARITQAMLQLIQNATTHGGGAVELSSAIIGSRLLLRVRDHGPGIPDEDKQRIFERFQRLQDGGRGPDGSGLGLSIVQLIAEQHGGEALVEDAEGGGALFTLSIPISPDAASEADDADTLEPQARPTGGE
ncbi:HAMP domain-containing histidine kinase [Microbacterium sp. M28]|uniref:sensor histidine kinase n=1 Tax=Microbacterium sp. M28 TaxID=2962064 RepID=UPI0021F3D65A|nr:HAMP domain-containing sensor histidine kinase [Microbacterium sp. M28]UYO96982.1 HAMP domain-containing histidine kinase [Microbacterium sp. M28]